MILCGIGDEAGSLLASQLQAARELGWRHIEARNLEVPGFPKANLHDLPEAAFERAVDEFATAGVGVYCFASSIMNWSKRISDPFDPTLAEVRRAIPRMQRMGSKFVRVMSYKPEIGDDHIPDEVIRRVRVVTNLFLEAGIQPLHENCMNFGGMSWRHALQLLEAVPGLQWLFDTANPIFNADRSQPQPWPRQDPWEFWTRVRDRVTHIHVKDARWNPQRNDADYMWPGEGDGAVREILADAFSRGYDAGISIEPHMVAVFHDAKSQGQEAALRENFVEYGRRLERLMAELPAKGSRGTVGT